MESLTDSLRYPIVPDSRHAASLDPLHFDDVLPAVWKMNAASDVKALVRLLHSLLPTDGFASEMSSAACVAAMRDLGVLLGSIKRCGVEPVVAVPEAEAALLELGARTEMKPRDTIFHYIGWNPTGARERMYTGDRMESSLISSVRITLPRLVSAVDECRRLMELEPGEPEFALVANEMVALIRSLEDSIDIVVGNVTPEFFAQTMRPYFEAIRVGGVDYLGPAAAHVPLHLVDLALWASDNGADAYTDFWRESAQFSLPPWLPLLERWPHRASVATLVTSALAVLPEGPVPPHLRASAESLCRALRALVVFRAKHLTVARQAYDDEIRLHELGSGGGSVQLLEEVTSLVRANASSLRSSIASAHDGGTVLVKAGAARDRSSAADGSEGGAAL